MEEQVEVRLEAGWGSGRVRKATLGGRVRKATLGRPSLRGIGHGSPPQVFADRAQPKIYFYLAALAAPTTLQQGCRNRRGVKYVVTTEPSAKPNKSSRNNSSTSRVVRGLGRASLFVCLPVC